MEDQQLVPVEHFKIKTVVKIKEKGEETSNESEFNASRSLVIAKLANRKEITIKKHRIHQ